MGPILTVPVPLTATWAHLGDEKNNLLASLGAQRCECAKTTVFIKKKAIFLWVTEFPISSFSEKENSMFDAPPLYGPHDEDMDHRDG
jgi:aspartyl-tRNA synthetase